MPCIRSLRGRSKDRVCLEGGFTPKPMQGDLKLQLKRANAAFTKRNSAEEQEANAVKPLPASCRLWCLRSESSVSSARAETREPPMSW